MTSSSSLGPLWSACASPRLWHAALRRTSRAVRRATQPSTLSTVGSHFDGALVGEALIDTLSHRLATSLKWWNAPVAPRGATGERHRRTAPTDARFVSLAPPAALQMDHAPPTAPGRTWDGATSHARIGGPGMTHGDGAAPYTGDRAMRGESGPGGTPPRASFESMSERDAALLLARLWDVGNAVPHRLGVSSSSPSPLVGALTRYRKRATATPVHSTHAGPVSDLQPPAQSRRSGPASPREGNDDVASETVGAPLNESPRLNGQAADLLRANSTERRWWSSRIDAIHARTESTVPMPSRAAPSAPLPEDDDVFADALADVLRHQARAYGVDVA